MKLPFVENLPSIPTVKALRNLARLDAASKRPDSSFAGEAAYLDHLFSRLNITGGFVVDIAAADGVNQSSTLNLFKSSQWTGLAVEMDPEKFSKLAFIYADFPTARLARGRVTPGNVASLLRGFEVPLDFTLLNLDIDSYDLFVLEAMFAEGFRPKVISMEVNEKIPPPLYFTVEYNETHYWQGDHFYGCSITAASDLAKRFDYRLDSLEYNNAFFVLSEAAGDTVADLDPDVAYDRGYRSKPDRKTLFPWNANLEYLQEHSPDDSIAFLREHFKAYDGKYTLR